MLATERKRQASFGVLLLSAVLLAFAAGRPASAADEENYKVVQGLGVYLGVLPAAMVRGHRAGHPETTMHGGAPRGAHEYHLIIAVFDDATGARIENARVTANVSGLGNVTNIKDDSVSVIETASRTVVRTMTGRQSNGAAFGSRRFALRSLP